MPHRKQPNQLYRDFLGVCGLNPWACFDSSSRVQMFSSHIGQTLVIKGSTERRCQTGMEQEYAKYTFSIKTPYDRQDDRRQGIRVLKIVPRYPKMEGYDTIKDNPETAVIYENEHDKSVGVMMLRNFCSYHQYFGFQYKKTKAMSKLHVGAEIAPDTVLLDSPSVTDIGGYKYGRECNIAFMSHPAVSEDGIVIAEDVLKHFAFNTYETRVAEWGEKRFPLNLYGDENTYKPFPDIGDYIRPDGLLMALRSYDDHLSVVEQSVQALREPDFVFDKLIYAAGAGDPDKRSGRVVDIIVHHDSENTRMTTPMGMEKQADKYDTARKRYYHEILSEYRRLARLKGERLLITPEFQRLVVEATSVVGDAKGRRVLKLYRQAPLDDYRVTFVIEYEVTPTIGFKLTDCHGGKGVICHIAKPEEMPVDEAGNRADIIMDPNATNSRMNPGRLYEQYINAASRDVHKRLVEGLGVDVSSPLLKDQIEELQRSKPEVFHTAWDYLLGYYQIVSPKMYVWLTTDAYHATSVNHLVEVLRKGVYLYMPPENDPEGPEMIRQLQKAYAPTYGPVSYIGYSGQRVTTKKPVRIGSVYVILLEKTGDDWTAVSSGKLQHFGVLSQVTNADKFSLPIRVQAIRAWGESEVRIGVSYAGPALMADILDRNNNPSAHRNILENVLTADRPTDIEQAVDRTKVPLGGSKSLQLVKHIAQIAGWEMVYFPHKT